MLSAEVFQEIYRMLNDVDAVPYDCGKECGAACCRDDCFRDGAEPYIYLLPGEKEYLEHAGSRLKIWKEPREEHNLPESYGEYVYVAACGGPEACERVLRPIQCRTFPLMPCISEGNELILDYYDGELPYTCPLVEERRPLSEEFYRVTYAAWEMLIRDEAIKDMILIGF